MIRVYIVLFSIVIYHTVLLVHHLLCYYSRHEFYSTISYFILLICIVLTHYIAGTPSPHNSVPCIIICSYTRICSYVKIAYTPYPHIISQQIVLQPSVASNRRVQSIILEHSRLHYITIQDKIIQYTTIQDNVRIYRSLQHRPVHCMALYNIT